MTDDMAEDMTEGHPADYTGLHAFLFIDHVEPGKTVEEVVRELRAKGKPPIMYASTVVGDYQALVHARVRRLGELQDLIEDTIWPSGARCTWGVESRIGTFGAKRKSLGLIALTRIKMRHGSEDEARTKLVTRPHKTGFVGVSKITGEHGLLLQMTGDSIDDAEANIRNALSDVEGVLRTSTAFADGDRTEERYGEIPLNAMPDEAS
jgi:DNA-binding Lrp family transcriptional regulator